MSLITRCPACTTMFRVVPDQLRVSGGWVRCGHCQEVFDASANLQPTATGVAVQPTVQVDATPSTLEPTHDLAQETPHANPRKDEREPFLEVNPRALDLEHHASIEPELDPIVASEPMAPPNVPANDDEVPAIDPESAPLQQPLPSFVARQARRRSSVGSAVAWAMAASVLAVALCVQVVVHERDRIAATEPAALQVLNPLCAWVGCVVAPLRQVESVQIDNSAFGRLRGDVYRLAVTYKNTAPVPIEAPALELTLTDLQDQPVVRRVFTTKELGLPRPTLDAGGEQAMAVSVALKMGHAPEKVSGYRLLAFYP